MITQEHIQNAVDRASNNETILDEAILSIEGFSTKNIRNLFAAICDTGEPITYLEIGLFFGASFCSTFNKNVIAIGIEDHSQDFSAGFERVKKELKENLEKYSDRAKEVKVHYADCFNMDLSIIPNNIDIYCYDANHSLESTAKALPYFLDKMADTFVLICDDLNWTPVYEGLDLSFAELKDKIEIKKVWVLRGYNLQNDAIWHNGIGLYLINKKK